MSPADESVGAHRFPTVGIGASAGGLAAIEAFFSAIPAGGANGIAFVIVQHLAPHHKSLLGELISRFTTMAVAEATDGTVVEPNSVYIIPPNRDMTLVHGLLRLAEPGEPRGQRLPIDLFFRSLAADLRERAICIVLSGSGSDGALGVRAVKGEGGMAMAQEPESAEYANMPQAAIDTGAVDYVRPPAELPAALIAYTAHVFGAAPHPISLPPPPDSPETLQKIFLVLRAQTGHDFSLYKRNTVTRRLERRMAVNQLARLDDYLLFLADHPAEVQELFRDILIGVTSFFRDPAAFAMLEQDVIPKLMTGHPAQESVRVWVPGCSTGEEAYSLAILLQARAESLKRNLKIQVFGTDLDATAIARARAGCYRASIAADIAPERLARYFSLEEGGSTYRIRKSIRDLMVFSEQDLIRDPPFSRMDLISCRNLLIYLGAELQKAIIPMFHYALRPGGFLLLGTSETVSDPHLELFAVVDSKWKVYQSRADGHGSYGAIGRPFGPRSGFAAMPEVRNATRGPQFMAQLVERTLLREFSPASVLVTGRGEILHCHGRTGQYLEPAPGKASMNILTMARQGLQRELVTALRESVLGSKRVHRPGLRVKTNGDYTAVDLTVLRLSCGPGDPLREQLFLAIFEPATAMAPVKADGLVAGEAAGSVADVTGLKLQLEAKDDYLQAANEELATANEELKSANEEMQSMNEELQSTNEELETSREELQSINEELATVNAELQHKLSQLTFAHNDMSNLLAGTGIGTIFVDHNLRILRFTPTITQVVNLIPADVGRPVGHIVSNLVGYDRLGEDLEKTLDTLLPTEAEVTTRTGQTFLLRIRPYRTQENVIEGAVITFVDITEVKRVQDALRESDAKCRVLFDSMPQGVIFYNGEGRLAEANSAAERMLGSTLLHMRENGSPLPAIHADGTEFNWEASPAMVALKTGQPVEGVVMGLASAPGAAVVWVRVEALPIFKGGAGQPFQVYTTLTRIERT